MLHRVRRLCVSSADWWIRRNPTYLLSGICIALGARLYLVSPSARAGDLGVILMTLGFVQFYEWAVAAVLILLHRWQRSPEDQPSLLLVAALFWTGPLAATTEMTAEDPKLGLGVCLIAISELYAVARALKLRFSVAGIVLACGCVMLVAAAPWWLHVPEDGIRTDELYMYLAWWILAGLSLLGLGIGRIPARSHETRPDPVASKQHCVVEHVFLTIVVAVSAAHLYGMNYSLFTHARLFYASPLIVALTLVLFHHLPTENTWGRFVARTAALLPAGAILLTKQPFHELVPLELIPRRLADPTTPVLAFAAVAWWFGDTRHRWVPMLHAGSAAAAWAVWRSVRFGMETPVMPDPAVVSMEPDRDLIAMGLYAIALYLFGLAVVRRSRGDAVAGLVAQQAAATMFLWDRTIVPHADMMMLLLLGGWSWLGAFCLLERRAAAGLRSLCHNSARTPPRPNSPPTATRWF